jgi:hypothetical protein
MESPGQWLGILYRRPGCPVIRAWVDVLGRNDHPQPRVHRQKVARSGEPAAPSCGEIEVDATSAGGSGASDRSSSKEDVSPVAMPPMHVSGRAGEIPL